MPYKDPAKMAEYMRQRRAAKSGKVNVNPNVNRKPVNPNRKISQVSGSYENGYWVGICPACNHQNRMDPKRSYRPADRCEHFRRLLKPGTASEFIFSKELMHKAVNPKSLAQRGNPVNPSIDRKPVNRKTSSPHDPGDPQRKISFDSENDLIRVYKKQSDGSWEYTGIIPEGAVNSGIIFTIDNVKSPAELRKLRDLQKEKDNNLEVHNGKDRYLLSYSRNKYQFVLYAISPTGSRSLIKSMNKNEKLQLGPCEIELTWGPDPGNEKAKEEADAL